LMDNQIKRLWASRLKALQAWVQLLLVMVEAGDFDDAIKIQFMLQTLQTILPRLESNLENSAEAMELARLVKALLFSLNLESEAFNKGDLGELVSDRLFYLFRVSLRAITSVGANGALKEIFYSIGYRYLTRMSDVTGDATNGAVHGVNAVDGIQSRHSTQTVKAVGERLIELICDDALAGEKTCRIAALLLLGSLVQMADRENSKYIIESLNRLNFIGILVHSIKDVANDLRETQLLDASLHLQDFHARLALLVHIAQTRPGAAIVLNAGLFHFIHISKLFAIDPDLDLDLSDPDAAGRHYTLLAAMMRVICSAIVSRGSQNQQTLDQGRSFLSENRLAILAVLKRSAGLGVGNDRPEESIDDLADSFMLLMTITGFVDFEEQTVTKARPSLRSFT